MAQPIDTKTDLRKIRIDNDMPTTLRLECDSMGVQGYLLSSSFVLDNHVVLVFQQPPAS